MREIKLIQFTYEDVRLALQKAYPDLDIQGVKVADKTGYLVQTCGVTEEPCSNYDPYQQRKADPGKEAA